MNKPIIKSILIVVVIFSAVSSIYALDVETHRAINENIAQNALNGFSLDEYLKNQLGLKSGVKEKLNSSMAWELLRDGGYYEDKPPDTIPYARSKNHFHNPLKPLGQAGYSPMSGKSAITWSQSPYDTQRPGGYYSWHDVRYYFLTALINHDRDTRDWYFAKTFRGLGQLMHLAEDMSVPEHARDDGHVADAYEEWVKETQSSPDLQRRAIFDTALANPIFFNTASLNSPSPFGAEAPVPIARLFDANQYDGTNPQVTLQSNIGLSEYTNANFLSKDTMFESSGFPYPRTADTTLWVDNNRVYMKKTGNGETVNHLAVTSLLHLYRLRYFPQYSLFIPVALDDACYQDYAQKLLPRAVGFSAGLLDYFFRGKIDMEPTDTTDEYTIKNNSLNEAMAGSLRIYFDDAQGNRALASLTRIGSDNQPISLNNPMQNFTLGASASTGPMTIAPPGSPQPQDKGRYVLAFKGTLGNETVFTDATGNENGAVVGRVKRWWREEWDGTDQDGNPSITGNHAWLQESNVSYQTYSIQNSIVDGKLTMEHILYGRLPDDPNIHDILFLLVTPNATHINRDFSPEFPLPITRNTRLHAKIDEMIVDPAIPYVSECEIGDFFTHGQYAYQYIRFVLDNGITFSLTVPGQEPPGGDNDWFTWVDPGVERVFNIFETFQAAGVTLQEPVNLIAINAFQTYYLLCEEPIVAYVQRMVVDYIRLED